MKAIFKDDLVTGIGEGNIVGLPIPDALADFTNDKMRVVNGVVTDITARTSWFIDGEGRKRISQLDPSWQALTCAWDAQLIYNGTWQVIDQATLDAQRIEQAEMHLDTIADSVYTRSVSRAARYERKLEQAAAYKTASYPEPIDQVLYAYVAKEAIERSITNQAMADLILARAAAFEAFGATIEALRAKLDTDVTAATDDAGRKAAVDAIIATAETEKSNLLGA